MRLISSGAGGVAGRIALIALFACVIAMSALNSALRTDSHHWGLMLSNALDLSEGRIPYKDFIIQYGYFTTLAQLLWGSLFGFSFLSFGILTAMVYCGLLYQVYAVIRHLSAPWAAALFLAVAFVLHPFPIYPWADYYAGFFLSGAIVIMFANRAATPARLIIAGILLGLAVWSRYTYAVAIVPFLLTVLISGRYSLRGWITLLLSFVTTNLLFLAAFEFGYGIDLVEALRVYREIAEAHGTEWLSQERIENLLVLTRIEDGFLVYLWLATFPLFFEAARKKQLSRRELGAYAALSVLGLVNLIHAIRIFEYFRVINSSFSLAIVSFWMIANAVRVLQGQNNAETPRHGAFTFIVFIRKAPLILIIPLLLIASFSIRILWDFPLNTYNLQEHAPGIWRDTRGLGELTRGKVGRVNFSNASMLAFYRDLSSELCGNRRVFSYIEDNIVGHICDHRTNVRMAGYDRILHSRDQPEYQKVYVRGELSDEDAVLSISRRQSVAKDFLCLNRREFIAPDIEYVAKAGTKYLVRTKCKGKLQYGEGWSLTRTWAVSEHAEIHVMNYGNRPLRAKFMLTLSTFEPRNMTIRLNGKVQQSAALIPDRPVSMHPDQFRLLPGDNLLQFDGDAPAKASTDLSPIHLTYNLAIELIELSEE
jgi:hypothetical protein